MNKDVLYQVVKDIYTSKVFKKDVLDFRLMIFNQKFKSLFKKYENVEERMRNIEEIFSLIGSYLGDSLVERKVNGEVFTFKSLDDASSKTNTHKSNICSYLKKKVKPRNGDIWEYI